MQKGAVRSWIELRELKVIPVFKPRLPTCDKILPYLQRIDANRWYTNHGPLLVEFEHRLAKHFQTESARLITSANATLAILQCLVALKARQGSYCVMPSWTFAATPAAATWAGLKPYFADVSGHDWQISPEAVKTIARGRDVGAVIVVSAFGAPVDLPQWDRFAHDTGIPTIIDAAAGFDGFAGCGRDVCNTPVVISLHATKVSGIGEGAVVITGDAQLAAKMKMLGNFGFHGSRDSLLPGINMKLSEYAAANGLALLDDWPERRAEWATLSDAFAAEVASTPSLSLAPKFNNGWISSYGLVELPSLMPADIFMARLLESGVESRQWWGKGCHHHTAYCDCERSAQPETERLATYVLGLPFWLGLSRQELAKVFHAARHILSSCYAEN